MSFIRAKRAIVVDGVTRQRGEVFATADATATTLVNFGDAVDTGAGAGSANTQPMSMPASTLPPADLSAQAGTHVTNDRNLNAAIAAASTLNGAGIAVAARCNKARVFVTTKGANTTIKLQTSTDGGATFPTDTIANCPAGLGAMTALPAGTTHVRLSGVNAGAGAEANDATLALFQE